MTSISDQVGMLRDPREEHHRQDRAEEAAVERHAAVPQREDLERVLGEAREIVEEHVADAAAEDDAERAPDDEIVDVGRLHRRAGRPPESPGCATRRLAYHQPRKMPTI